jgi:serine/threonine protein phosphatase PrpC
MDTSPYIFDTGSATHTGRVRSRNEDAHLVRTDVGLWAVADGMGGHEAGDLASQLIVKALNGISATSSAVQLLEQTENLIFLANQQIMDISRQRGGTVMGSTVAVLLISEDHYACIWAGDSRVYLVRRKTITQLSRDHTEIEEMPAKRAMSAEEVRHLPQNVITRAVGVQENPELEIVTGSFEESDIFVLCSDGLTKHVSDDEIMHYVSGRDAQAASTALVNVAVERGGLDNVTVVVVRAVPKQPDGRQPEPPKSDIWE